ncbi:hypothetical protein CS369_05890 [Candidatus Symbiopectobacterium sp. 'North America']|nr:hypothetical protein [Candidatus Symbiopectobacterium sp. 'North America']
MQAIVTDANNNPLAGQAVTFTADNGATVTTVIGTTSAEGIASATLTNTRAGVSTVIARLANNASKQASTSFIADDSTAQISTTNLTVTQDNAVADGEASNHVQAIVTDANNNPLAGQTLTFMADNNAMIATQTGTTGPDGVASTTLTNTNAGQTIVTATLDNNASQSVKTTFVQNLSIQVETTANSAIANEEYNTVTARVVNALGNPVANVNVDFSSVESGITLSPSSGKTNQNGKISSSVA